MNRLFSRFLSISSLVYFLLLLALWFILAEGIEGSWFFGLPIIICVLLSQTRHNEEKSFSSFSFVGGSLFLLYFLWQSMVSGFDVAFRALRPDMGLHPALISYRISLPKGTPQRLFVHSITLMPGTLSVFVQGDSVKVHVLDARQPVEAALKRLENRVAAVFLMDNELEA